MHFLEAAGSLGPQPGSEDPGKDPAAPRCPSVGSRTAAPEDKAGLEGAWAVGMLHLSSGTARCGSEPVKLPARSRGTEQGSAAGAEAWGTRSTVGRTGRATHAGYTCRVVATSEWSPHQEAAAYLPRGSPPWR